MTSREIIEKTLAFEKTPRIPFAVLAGYTWICKHNGLSTAGVLRLPDAGAKISVEAYEEMGSDLVYGGGGLAFAAISAMGGKVDNDIVGNASEILARPLSELEDIENFDLEEVKAKMLASEEYILSKKQVAAMRALVGNEKHIVVGGFGAFTIASQMMGVDNFLVSLMDDEDGYADKVLHFAAELIMEFNKGMLDAGGDAVILCEPVASGDLISQRMFEEYVLPVNREMIARTKELCPFVLVHICGDTSKRVAGVAGSGASVFSVDSIDLVKASGEAQGNMVLFGNLSPAGIVLGMSSEEVYAKSLELCEKMKGTGGFILAPGCDLAPDTPLENIQAMARAAAEVSARQ
ncbi:MAG: hypothetical protein J5859_06690 [Clostridia bacterium]|nr:hypothetical protein [Clostridia bacterium]